MEIGLLRNFESTLRYLNGNCSWEATTPGGFENILVAKSQEITILGVDVTNGLVLKCLVGGAIKLHAVFSLHGNKVAYTSS